MKIDTQQSCSSCTLRVFFAVNYFEFNALDVHKFYIIIIKFNDID